MTTMIVDELARIPMSPFLTATLTRAADYATAQAHREVTLEHLLLALAEDPEATIVLKASHIDLDRLTAEVSDHLGRDEDRVDPSNGQPIVISADLRRILEAAAAAARQGRRREINGAIVLAAIVGDGKSPAAHMLRVQGLTFEEAIRALQNVTTTPQPAPQPPAPQQLPPPQHRLPQPQPQPQPVEQHRPAPAPYAPPREDERTGFTPEPPAREAPPPDPTRPATTEEILAAARERLEARSPPRVTAPAPALEPGPASTSAGQVPMPRANYPDLGGPPPRPAPAPAPVDNAAAFELEHAASGPPHAPQPGEGREIEPSYEIRTETRGGMPSPASFGGGSWDEGYAATRDAPPPQQKKAPPRTNPPATQPRVTTAGRRRTATSGPFVGSWPLIEAGQLVENIPRRMRVGLPVVIEARIARGDVKSLAEGLAGGGAAFRHEVVVTKAMSVRLRSPGGGFIIENRSPETQWIENVLGLGNDDYASWRWTVTPMARGRRQLQLIVSARTVGSDGVTAETALPDQVVDVKVAINLTRTALKWAGWIGAAIVGGLLAKFGETAWVVTQILFARHFGG